ncbi:type III secretion system stalk subunit SctO [Pseudomonas fontis]|uniref:Type III secretion protein n=1 Tax=Pseudomonas fontis TaxID=2942633 RepID=A0ABT5P031_9PSED|nr:YscO family type III secretion system apparatus protein [Pseudomonas fontis]MDD0976392.1 type III secretion protein [Pseudomonas fontis]MDD0993722.1 type III secretion protein [Pseudomonas fontis]
MPLSTLVRIKLFKLDKAERDTRQQLAQLRSIETVYQQSIESLQRYRDWRLGEEATLLACHQGQVLERKTLAQWQRQVAAMRAAEACLVETLDEQTRLLDEQLARLRRSQQQLASARQQAEKFNQLQQQAFAEQRSLLEHKEALELEAFTRQGIQTFENP